ncbi:MAG TPA: VOC family protein [Amycolatopsis sp.]|nr:VOC family protein [Amycolatopsis sp.]
MPQRPVVGMYAFRARDPRRLAGFWAELMDLPISDLSTDELVMLDFDHTVGPVTWMFERDPAAGDESSRVGLDIGGQAAGDWRDIADRAERAGAERIAERRQDAIRWIEMRDPEGNPFRVFAPRP